MQELTGRQLNNVAEYSSLRCTLQRVTRQRHTHAHVQLDSKLVVCQVNGLWRCRSENLQVYWNECHEFITLLRDLGCVVPIEHIYREFNADADALANRGADGDNSSLNC